MDLQLIMFKKLDWCKYGMDLAFTMESAWCESRGWIYHEIKLVWGEEIDYNEMKLCENKGDRFIMKWDWWEKEQGWLYN